MSLFEAHITCDMTDNPECAERATRVAEGYHWKTSEIARDPVLGEKTYFYLTSHSSSYDILFNRMESASNALRLHGIAVVREKIEEIVYDTKVGLNRNGAKQGPAIFADEHGCAGFTWQCGERRLVLTPVGHPHEGILKSWGKDIADPDGEEYVSLMDAEKVREAFAWLARIPEVNTEATK